MNVKTIVILGDVPSKKNSKQIFRNKATGRMFISSSDLYKRWEKEALLQLLKYRSRFDKLDQISVKFFPSNRRRFDLSNKFESIADLLVLAQIISDDNYTVMGKVFLEFGDVDRVRPRVEIVLS